MTSAPPGTVCLITPDPVLDLWFPPDLGDEQPSDPDVNNEQILVPVSLPCARGSCVRLPPLPCSHWLIEEARCESADGKNIRLCLPMSV